MALTVTPVPPGPPNNAFAVTPSDASVFAKQTKQIWVGTTGNLAVLMWGDTVSVILTSVPAGTMLSLSVQKILATGTTASNMIAFT